MLLTLPVIYVIRTKKFLHNRIEIIEIVSNHKEYEFIVTPLSAMALGETKAFLLVFRKQAKR